MGLMASMEFAESGDGANAQSIADEMFKRGFLVGFNPNANLIRFLPPLTIEENEIEAVVENLKFVLEKLN
jgi:4-aminobutyrate aminotransferase-like enzyme